MKCGFYVQLVFTEDPIFYIKRVGLLPFNFIIKRLIKTSFCSGEYLLRSLQSRLLAKDLTGLQAERFYYYQILTNIDTGRQNINFNKTTSSRSRIKTFGQRDSWLR
jgi:hypothetical protein